MVSVKLEILRDGPPHNHLLSPLTKYLALCGDHSSGTITVPFEHAQVLERLRGLSYVADDVDAERRRQFELSNFGREMGHILEQAPGLIKDLADANGCGEPPTHLRIVLSANELALLPFELAIGCVGFPGSGEHLCLQATSPICVTREIRRVAPPNFTWPRQPRILFVTASPSGFADVPAEAHLLALRQAINPWVFHFGHTSQSRREEQIGGLLKVIVNASARAIADECATGGYTHVHILAHGMPATRGEDRRFGLALHDPMDPEAVDFVDGARLATALRPHKRDGNRELACPVLVTIATCDGGNVGTSLAPGASVAHDLHRAGIPLVIASQFPLSFEGSVHLTRLLYEPLLWGQDPRLVLDDVRRQLSALVPRRHDWASLVAYAALPTDLRFQLRDVTFSQARSAIEAAMSHLDACVIAMCDQKLRENQEHAEDALNRVRRACQVLDNLRRKAPDRAAEIDGLLGSAQKRLAQYHIQIGSTCDSENCIRSAKRHYEDAFAGSGYSWALVQTIFLSARQDTVDAETWRLAWYLSKREKLIYGSHDERYLFALNNLAELVVLAELNDDLKSEAALLEKEIVTEVTSSSSWKFQRNYADLHQHPAHALKRQLERYNAAFFPKISEATLAKAQQFVELLKASGI